MSDSIWKKEISFRRKPKPFDEFAEVEPVGDAPKQSFLKKEISFSRKQKEPKAPKEPKPEGESFLKKEISFSRKQKAERELERLAREAAQAVEAEAAAVHFAPPTELAESVLAAMPDPAPVAPVEYEPAEFEPVAFEPPVEQTFEQTFELPPPPPLAAVPEPVAQPVAEPVAPAAEWAAPEPAPEPEPWLAEPELPPAPAFEEPVTVHPPVPAAELPPLAEAEPKVPFWKKEVSLSRKPKAPKAEKAPKAPKVKGESAPFWKKELSLGRKKAAAAEETTVVVPAAKAQPFWKKQLSLPKPGMPRVPSGGGRKKGHRVQKLVGLKIGASQLAAARVSNNGVAELQQVARDPLAAGVVVGGELRDPEALGDALKVFFARHKLPKKGVRLGIASNRIGVRIIEIAGVAEEKQLANAVQFRAQEALPIPLDEAVLDYRVLDEAVGADGQVVKRVLLVVAYRELVERYISACQKAGLVLAGIDLEAFALLRALGAPQDRGGSALVAIAIGHDRSTFAVSDGRICEFTRVVEWGGSSLNVALARAFDSTPSEVEELKRSLSLDGAWAPEGLTDEQVAVALDAVRRQIQSFARELVSSLQFYQNQPGSLGIGEIVVTGGTAQMPGLAEELERLIGVHVRVGNPLARLKVARRVSTGDHTGSLAVAIGLGIED